MKLRIAAAVAGVLVALVVGPKVLDRAPPEVIGETWSFADPASPGATATTDGAAPTVPLRGNPNLELRIQDHFAGGATTVQVDGIPQEFTLEERGSVLRSQLDLSGLTDGQHMVTVTLHDRAWPANRTQMSRMLVTDTTPPTLTLGLGARGS